MMRKLFCMITVLLAFAAGAQTITEAQLLGEWKIVKINLDGIVANLETDEVTVANPNLEASPEDIKFVKNMINGPEGDEFRKGRLIFKTGGILDIVDKRGSEQNTYVLINEGDGQVIEVEESPGDSYRLSIAFKDGELVIGVPDSSKIMNLKRVSQ